MKEYVIGKER